MLMNRRTETEAASHMKVSKQVRKTHVNSTPNSNEINVEYFKGQHLLDAMESHIFHVESTSGLLDSV